MTTAKERLVEVSMRNFATVLVLLIMSFTILSSPRVQTVVFRPTKNWIAQLLLRLPRETCLDGAEHDKTVVGQACH